MFYIGGLPQRLLRLTQAVRFSTAIGDAMLTDRIRWIHQQAFGTYCAPRIYAELRTAGGPRGTKTSGPPDAHGRYQREIPQKGRAYHLAIR